ncbi:Retrovirus-related Pol polyprotein from transposon TNT 1-94 Includes: RecName: Full=Protease; Includes: RecName: Full=Reverse transcriptase; Includes: RecName: Full=Endonuclease [Serendipita indica DSM 11827]|nr:Retrovirus-related Pol polyprotein from transposon TNT 1-94 Includes: RecName: Full=Protease; Includes: RecName: Full=Reverse transcriptase; Includes: RecName: Full=Endonuclease [Serendipita indica DSM 11827]
MAEKLLLSTKDSPQTEQEKLEMQNVPYREALGKLIYIATATRPDISYSVGVLCRFSENPGRAHWLALKRVLRYLRKTTNYKLTYGLEPDSELFTTHSDADLGGNADNTRSTAGFVMSIGGGAVMWSSRLQRHTSLSSTESEYTTTSATGCEIIWMRSFLDEIGYHIASYPSTLFVDNASAIQVAKNPENQSTMKHVHRSFNWIRERVANNEIRVAHVPGAVNVADVFTKPLGRIKFEQFVKNPRSDSSSTCPYSVHALSHRT